MFKQLKQDLQLSWRWLDIFPALYVVFGICWVYWFYLIFSSQMYIVFDAKGYEGLGKMLYEKGWAEFFRTGPHREPLYPWLISISMHLADIFSCSYQVISKFLQVALLFSTQFLLLIALRQVKIHKTVVLPVILYCGFSPAFAGATFGLFSEIVTMPFVLLSLICMVQSWHILLHGSMRLAMMMALLTAGGSLLLILSKGVFLGVFLLYLIMVFITSCVISVREKKYYWPRASAYIFLSLICVLSFMLGYMSLYKKYSGSFQYTDRYSYVIFGSAYKRSQKLTPRIFWAHVASIPGKGICRRFFSEEECVYCEAYSTDYFAGTFLPQALGGVPFDKQDAKVLQLTKEQIKKNLGQYVMFMVYEAARMPFWESTQAGFVGYPPWLNRLFSWGLFKDGIRLFISCLTIGSLIFMTCHIPRYYRALLEIKEKRSEQQVCFFVVFIVLAYTSFFTLTFVLTRYALPIAPLYLVMIACWLNRLFGFNDQRDTV